MISALFITAVTFRDKTDGRSYAEGDIYPHNIHKLPTEERANELVELGYIRSYIQMELKNEEFSGRVPEEYPKHTGGGYYELSNGEKVKGKEAAEEAENVLKGD